MAYTRVQTKILDHLITPAGAPVLLDVLKKHSDDAKAKNDDDRLLALLEMRKYALELQGETGSEK